MTELVIEGWTCSVGEGCRFVIRETHAGDAHAWAHADGKLNTEFRPNSPDETGDVNLPPAVLAWLIRPMLRRAYILGHMHGLVCVEPTSDYTDKTPGGSDGNG